MSAVDDTLVSRLRAGDETAFATLVRELHGPLLRLARAFVGSHAVAEEVVQETWLGVIKGIERFEGRSSLKTWVFRILSNRAKTRAARERRSISFSDLGTDDAEAELFDASGTFTRPPGDLSQRLPLDKLLDAEARQAVERALAELPHNQRVVVTMRDVQGWTSDEVRELLGISEANQRVLLHRGRARARLLLLAYVKS